jgi:hypothetical protein
MPRQRVLPFHLVTVSPCRQRLPSDYSGPSVALASNASVAKDLGCVKMPAREGGAELFSLLSSPDSGRQRFCFSN